MNLISTLKKTVTSIHEMFDPVVTRSKPRFVFVQDSKSQVDPAGNPRTNVYKRDTYSGSGPAH